MATLREQASQICFLLNTAAARLRERRIHDAIDSTLRATTIIGEVTSDLDRWLGVLRDRLKACDLPDVLRILCIDDNRDVADSEVLLLRAIGFDARACYSGVAALQAALAFRPSICLIDLNMPGLGGDELAKQLRAHSLALVLVAVTAMDETASRERIRAAGFDWHLVKPADPNELIRLIDRVDRGPRNPFGSSCKAVSI